MYNLDGLKKVKEDLMKQQKVLNKTMESFTSGKFQDKLREIMYKENAEAEKKVTIKKRKVTMTLMRTGEVVLKFENEDDARKFFDGQ